MKYLLTIAFDGSRYCGYQKQNNGISVQQVLTQAASEIFGECKITGCSRTDSGVHAMGFKATLECERNEIPQEKIPIAMNCHLPDDISVLSARIVSDEFHPRYSVKSKEYRYVIHNDNVRDPFLNGRAYHYPKPLDVAEMKEAAGYFVGEHDFAAFMASGSKIVDTVRTIYSCDVITEGKKVTVCVKGNGFLYNMVRIIVGTLIYVSEGKISSSDIPEIIKSKDRKNAGITVPAHGLYLYNVEY